MHQPSRRFQRPRKRKAVAIAGPAIVRVQLPTDGKLKAVSLPTDGQRKPANDDREPEPRLSDETKSAPAQDAHRREAYDDRSSPRPAASGRG